MLNTQRWSIFYKTSYFEIANCRESGRAVNHPCRESLKSEWDTGASVLGAFKLDHLQPVKLILFQNVSTFSTFMLGGLNFLITPEKGRKEAAGAGVGKMGITQKWMRHRGFCTFCIQIGPFDPVKLILFIKKSRFLFFILGGPISYYPRERKKGSSKSWKWEKVITQKWMRHRGFSNWGIPIGPFAAC